MGDRAMPKFAEKTLTRAGGKLTQIICDVSDGHAVREVFERFRPDRVVHAAVITAGDEREFREFERVVDVNVKGTANVLQSALNTLADKVIYVSSGSAYGNTLFAGAQLLEESPMVPDSLYSITKHASERICARFRHARNLNVTCVRLGSVFGPWERDTGVRDTLSLPMQILQRALCGEEIRLPAQEPKRDWIYSRDVARGLATVLEAPSLRHEVYNLGSGYKWCNVAADWSARLRAVAPGLRARATEAGEQPNVVFFGGRDRAMMGIYRLTSETGFKPRFDQKDALADYAAWVRENQDYFQFEQCGAT